jgi:hypothetical protein
MTAVDRVGCQVRRGVRRPHRVKAPLRTTDGGMRRPLSPTAVHTVAYVEGRLVQNRIMFVQVSRTTRRGGWRRRCRENKIQSRSRRWTSSRGSMVRLAERGMGSRLKRLLKSMHRTVSLQTRSSVSCRLRAACKAFPFTLKTSSLVIGPPPMGGPSLISPAQAGLPFCPRLPSEAMRTLSVGCQFPDETGG